MKTIARRRVALSALLVPMLGFLNLIWAGVIPVAASDPCSNPANAIIGENCQLGDPPSEWDVSGPGGPSIQGFATEMSYDRGETVEFKIRTDASAFQLDIYRLGYYAGQGARHVATVQPSVGLPQVQPACLTDHQVGLIDCGNWAGSAQWTVPPTATSGVYFAKLGRTDGIPGSSHIYFVVRDDASHSDILFQTSDTTWQAYNTYGDYGGNLGDGTSLYEDQRFLTLPRGHALKVSYNRPFKTRRPDPGFNPYVYWNFLFTNEYAMIRWLEANGYNVSYFSGIDTDRRGSLLLKHKVFLSVGHDEYWSAGQRANVEAARDAGVHLAFFSGNEVFWKTRWEPSIDGSGTPYRTLVTYKETAAAPDGRPGAGAKVDPSPIWTGTWRDGRFTQPAGPAVDGGQPENALTGQLFTVGLIYSGNVGGFNVPSGIALTVPYEFRSLRFWRNTPLASLPADVTAGLPAPILGSEADEDIDNGARPPGTIRLSSTTVQAPNYLRDEGSCYGPGTAAHSLTLYRHSSGALVFASGTINWALGLEPSADGGPAPIDANVQQATVNLLADMGVQPGSLQPDLVPAHPSLDTVAPSTTITAPLPGATISGGSVAIMITGTAADAGGGRVAAVEVSLDGGATWHPAVGRENWTYQWRGAASGQVTIKSRAIDDSGNMGAPAGVTINVVALGQGGPFTFTLGDLELSASPADWDEFLASAGVATYTHGVSGLGDVRPWIGVSTCVGCGRPKKQRLRFGNLQVGRPYRIAVFPAWVADVGTAFPYVARIVSGSGTVTSFPKQYGISGYKGPGDAWRVEFVPSTRSVTLELGNDAVSGTHYMMFDAIVSTVGVVESTASSQDSDEFAGTCASPVYTMDKSGLDSLRPWIGVSNCSGCGGPKAQRIRFEDLTPETGYGVLVYPSWVSPSTTMRARVVGGSATISSGASRDYGAGGYQRVTGGGSSTWKIVFVPGSPSVTLELYNSYGSGDHYFYFDAIGVQ